MGLNRCVKCVTPETHETVIYNNDGVCNICEQISYKDTKINWDKRKVELSELIETYRGKYDYDC